MGHLKTITCISILVSTQFAFGDISTFKNFGRTVVVEPTTLIKAGSRTAEQNKKHQEVCAENGAVDMTDLSDINIGSGVTDVAICVKSNSDPFPIMNTSGSILSPTSVPNVGLTTEAPNGNVGTGPYWIRGIANYSGGQVGAGIAMKTGVPDDNCQVTGGANIPAPNGTAYIQVTCSYPTGINPTPSYMQALLQGVQSTSYGTITHNP